MPPIPNLPPFLTQSPPVNPVKGYLGPLGELPGAKEGQLEGWLLPPLGAKEELKPPKKKAPNLSFSSRS